MALQVALGGVRVKRGPTTIRIFYGCPAARRRTEEEAAVHADGGCVACGMFVSRSTKLGTRERMREVAAKWGLDKPRPASDD